MKERFLPAREQISLLTLFFHRYNLEAGSRDLNKREKKKKGMGRMNFVRKILEEVVRFFSILEELYHAWSASPDLYVIILGRVIFAIIIIMIVVTVYGALKYFYERRIGE